MSRSTAAQHERWMRAILWLAALYHVSWGLLIVTCPMETLRLAGVDAAGSPQLWQGFGMIFAVFGIGYGIAARNPVKHWLLIVVGLLGKVLGPTGFLAGVLRGQLAWTSGWTFLTDDVVWWLPFSWVLYEAYRAHRTGDGAK